MNTCEVCNLGNDLDDLVFDLRELAEGAESPRITKLIDQTLALSGEIVCAATDQNLSVECPRYDFVAGVLPDIYGP